MCSHIRSGSGDWNVKIRKDREIGPTIPASKFDRWQDQDLINCIEAQMRRTGELFRGLSHQELDQTWVLSEMELHVDTALQAIRAMQRRVVTVQSL